MATRSLNVVISGDARQLGLATKQADDHMDKVGKSSARLGKAMTIGFGAAAAGAGLLVVGLKQVTDAAIEAQKSDAKMQAQLKASGISYRAHAAEISNVIQKTSQLAAVDDEDLQDAFTGLIRSTGNVKTSLHDLTLVTDLARAKNIDLSRAADLLGKVHAGNIGVLKRYGIAFDPVTAAQDKLKDSTHHATAEQIAAAKAADKTATSQAALTELQKRFGGQAEAYGRTAAGAQDRFKVAVENLKEMLGAKLLPIMTKVTNAVSKFVVQMQDGTGAGGGFARSLQNINDTLGPMVTAGGKAVAFLRKYEAVTEGAKSAFLPFIDAIATATRAFDALKASADAVVGAVKKVGSVFGSVGGAIKKGASIIGIGGDGLGKLAGKIGAGGVLPSGGAFGGSLMGAQSALKPFAAIGSRFGLSVSSGRRPGSITSSGNVSYHSSGEAIDMADGRGPDSNKMGFFQYMKSHFGGRLAELIYGPGGNGIKDGRPFNFGAALNAQHQDHVHVAFDTGRPGVGDGLGRFSATSYGPPWGGIQGGGTTATGVDLHSNPHVYGVAVDPSVIPLGSDLKITPNPFNYSGTFKAFDTGGAIKGKRIDFYDWRGRKAQLGWGVKGVTVSMAGSSSKGSAKVLGRGGATSKPGAVNPSKIYGGEDIPDSGITGPAKGLPQTFAEPAAAPTTQDYLNRNLALAQLTPDTADDKAVYQDMLADARGRLGYALNTGDVRGETQALQDIKTLTDSINSLDSTIQDQNALLQTQNDLFKQQRDDARTAYNVSQSQYDIVTQWIAGVANRGIGTGLGLSLSGLRSPAGSVART